LKLLSVSCRFFKSLLKKLFPFILCKGNTQQYWPNRVQQTHQQKINNKIIIENELVVKVGFKIVAEILLFPNI
jgi:hypothetical protein